MIPPLPFCIFNLILISSNSFYSIEFPIEIAELILTAASFHGFICIENEGNKKLIKKLSSGSEPSFSPILGFGKTQYCLAKFDVLIKKLNWEFFFSFISLTLLSN